MYFVMNLLSRAAAVFACIAVSHHHIISYLGPLSGVVKVYSEGLCHRSPLPFKWSGDGCVVCTRLLMK